MAAAQVAEKTVSLALLGVIIGRILDIPWYSTFTAGAPALALSALMAAVLYPLTKTLPPELALAARDPVRPRSSTSRCCGASSPTASRS